MKLQVDSLSMILNLSTCSLFSVKYMYRVPVTPLSNIISLAVKYLKGDPILNSKVLKNV